MGVPGVNVQGTLAGRPKPWRLGAGDRARRTRAKTQCPNPGKKWGAEERGPEMGQSSVGADRLERSTEPAGEGARLGTIPRGVRPAQRWGRGCRAGDLGGSWLAQ